MQISLTPGLTKTPAGQEIETILRSCVHCGLCNPACPTYNLLGNELDGPRGRIYQIKNLFEGKSVTTETQRHLDRCLSCSACETACPSGVQYSKLLDISRAELDQRVKRPLLQRCIRKALCWIIPSTQWFSFFLTLARSIRPLIPSSALKRRIPLAKAPGIWPRGLHSRRVLILGGCVQPSLEPNIDSALARVLDRHGISANAFYSGCCGSVSHHLSATEQTNLRIKQNIDVLWPEIEAGIEAIVITATGCGAMLQDYADLMKHDFHYAEKAAKVSALYRDPVQLLEQLSINKVGLGRRVAFHAPCTLVNALKLEGRVEALLKQAGFDVLPGMQSSQCCGSAGTYSLLQPTLAKQLRDRKLEQLHQPQPDIIATANIGCLLHLNTASELPVVHWLTLLESDGLNS